MPFVTLVAEVVMNMQIWVHPECISRLAVTLPICDGGTTRLAAFDGLQGAAINVSQRKLQFIRNDFMLHLMILRLSCTKKWKLYNIKYNFCKSATSDCYFCVTFSAIIQCNRFINVYFYYFYNWRQSIVSAISSSRFYVETRGYTTVIIIRRKSSCENVKVIK